ncbi:uncharacterized protein BDW47DRAFT_121428 [Aspergillus candidus]|uniref:Protein kinase domain-containing protein n=1 Tax=Aspergillus candidus TaxID=41067 RepID=A0A2I2EXR9_ASPCN|nr:hypothetical protein BDW47DRAFT_121428 [Aspergillus candidus]PLB33177.1 hypothetical protein BDW47DRAFT_121428 [Aspergillus candidus]
MTKRKTPDVFDPIRLSDLINERYLVEHKLASGGFSTVQGELVGPVKIPQSLRTENFHLGDFGLAKKVGDPVTPRGYPPLRYCSPDRLHRKDPSPDCDMWSGIIGGLVMSLGPLLEEWKVLYTHPEGRNSWYDQTQTPHPTWTLESRIALRPDAHPTKRSHRLTATQLLRDPSYRAIMENHVC